MSKFIFKKRFLIFISLCLFFSANMARAQTASISYQGKLNDGGVPANGQYDFVFKLYNENGVQFSFNVPVNDVPVTNGIFTVLIPFDEAPGIFLTGSRKFLEIAVRPGASTGAYTTLSPRQEFGTVPSAIYSRFSGNAGFAEYASGLFTGSGNVPASQFVQTNDARLSDARNPLAGSANYIQNSTNLQSQSNFNVSGNGSVGGTLSGSVVNAQSQFNIGGQRILGNPGFHSLYIGINAGLNTLDPGQNTFIGSQAGIANVNGGINTFVGAFAGYSNIGSLNSPNPGSFNSFFGGNVGRKNTTGRGNAFFGGGTYTVALATGAQNTTGDFNSFFGHRAGQNNDAGSRNAFFGVNAGSDNTAGNDNTIIGSFANTGNNPNNATAIGARAFANFSNTLILGSINGVNGATADTKVGIGTNAPSEKLHVNGNVRVTNGGIFIANPNTLVITSPNGACWGITVNNSGALATFSTPCP